ncbi:MAG TPA: acyltransferase [Pirellulales bacterium]|jgi:peptidoglycan/LPS O-acetylase OafA/YrhL|nr:acyltransferase [Pirellulales bacterium]
MTQSPTPTAAEQPPSRDHGKLSEIQVLRGISIVSVLLFHLSITPSLLEKSPSKITMSLFLGVEIFFIISGYVIANSLFRDQFSGARFFIKRAFRLLPAILVFFVLSFGLNAYFRHSDYSDDAKALFSVSNREFFKQSLAVLGGYFVLRQGPASYCNGAMWSLSVEDQFYAALTVLCLASGCLRSYRSKLAGPIAWAASGLVYLLAMAVRIGVLLRLQVENWAPDWLMYLTHRRFDFLALGIVLAFAEPGIRNKVRDWFRETGQFIAPFLLLLPFGLAALAEEVNYPTAAPILHGFVLPLTGICFGLLVLLAANGLAFPATRGPIHRAFVFLGDRSYTIYVFHFLAFALAWIVIYRFCPSVFANGIAYGCCQAAFSFAIMLPLCELIYKTVELPMARLGRRLAGSMGGPTSNEAVSTLAIDRQGIQPVLPAEQRVRGKAA